jgi:hypothetical protein
MFHFEVQTFGGRTMKTMPSWRLTKMMTTTTTKTLLVEEC